MIDLNLLFLFVGVMLFAYWINYCMGVPLSKNPADIDVDAIFFFFPYTLAVRKLKKFHQWEAIQTQWMEEIRLTQGARHLLQARREHMREVYISGREFFTWERAILCPVCFHFWLSLAIWAIFVQDMILFSSLFYLANHLLIRKIA